MSGARDTFRGTERMPSFSLNVFHTLAATRVYFFFYCHYTAQPSIAGIRSVTLGRAIDSSAGNTFMLDVVGETSSNPTSNFPFIESFARVHP